MPSQSNISNPIQIRREEDFYISSNIEIRCNLSFSIAYQWMIKNGTTASPIPLNLKSVANEYFLPARTLPLGLYRIEFLLTLNQSFVQTYSRSIYFFINPSGITANLTQLGTSMITSGVGQVLHFDPGSYSIDLDADDQFNASVRSIYAVEFCPLIFCVNRIGSTAITVEVTVEAHFQI